MRKPEQLTVNEFIQTVFVTFGYVSFPKKENATFILVFFLIKMLITIWVIMRLKAIYE
nr:MAG TPA: hypothetical protein [Caudoviricetes sp.]